MGPQQVLVFLALVAAAASTVAKIRRCPATIAPPELCSVTELRIDPCKTPERGCTLRKRHNASMEFDYTPNFSADKMKTAVYWADDPKQTPFENIGIADACPHTTCPLVSGTPNSLTYSIYIGRLLPDGQFWFRWKLWNADNEDQLCCFETLVKLKQ